jgi:hypothetical protein
MWLQIKRPVWRARGFARVRERYGDFGDRGVQDALALEDVKRAVERDHGEAPAAAPNQTGTAVGSVSCDDDQPAIQPKPRGGRSAGKPIA